MGDVDLIKLVSKLYLENFLSILLRVIKMDKRKHGQNYVLCFSFIAIFPLISYQGNQYAFCNSIFKIKNKKEY